MLVLSRRPDEKILFPTLGITVRILRVSGQTVRIGVDAPESVGIVRGELQAAELGAAAQPPSESPSRRLIHQFRGQLNNVTMAFYVAQKQLQSGLTAAAEETLQEALGSLDSLEKALSAPAEQKPTPREIRALLVEDNPYESALLASYLEMRGVCVEKVSDGLDALDYLGQHPRPDALLLDMRMPRCDGPTTIRAIRGNPGLEGLKIFAVSGSSPTEFDLAPTGAIDGWFTKPLNPSRIVETLTRSLQVN